MLGRGCGKPLSRCLAATATKTTPAIGAPALRSGPTLMRSGFKP
jgi:hypothetical protein